MLIEQLSDYSLKFTMSPDELAEYGLTFDSIASSDTSTRVMVSHLILLAKNQSGITVDFNHAEVFVEVFSCSNGNYVLYISLTPQYVIKHNDFLVCTTQDLNTLVRLSRQLVKYSPDEIMTSSLFTQDGSYYLMLETTKKSFEKVLYAVAEFCEYSTKRPTYATAEQWHCLAEYDAVYRLSILET